MTPSSLVLLGSSADLDLVDLAVGLDTSCEVVCALPVDEAQPLLERARGRGARRCAQVWAPILAELDYLAMVRVITHAVRQLGDLPQWIFSGEGRRGAIAPAVADALELPFLGSVVEISRDDQQLVLMRHSGRVMYQYRRQGPCVIGMIDAVFGANTDAGDHRGREVTGEIVHWQLADIGLNEAEIAYRRRFTPHPLTAPTHVASVQSPTALRVRLAADGYCDSAPNRDSR